MRASKITRIHAATVCAVALGLSVAGGAAGAADDANAICKTSMEAFMTATPTGDAAKVAANFTPNGEWVSPFGVLAGRKAITEGTATWARPGDKDADVLISARMIGDLAVCHGSYTFTAASGRVDKGFWTKVVRKTDEGWKLDVLVVATTPPQ